MLHQVVLAGGRAFHENEARSTSSLSSISWKVQSLNLSSYHMQAERARGKAARQAREVVTRTACAVERRAAATNRAASTVATGTSDPGLGGSTFSGFQFGSNWSKIYLRPPVGVDKFGDKHHSTCLRGAAVGYSRK